ncbi:substrate-binding domain-containing protein [Streptomyces sp. NPDC088341]|uniref:substrate-binding domain-containing protein n=1 Tax=Streptomyces sp. NPDC088341 TaxID=3154870 RepID=UPI003422448A
MNITSAIRSAAIAVTAALAVSLLAPAAVADPPQYRRLVGVGSDTTQDVLSALGSVVADPDGVPHSLLIGSYDATGPSPIKTRPVGCQIPRPNGSHAGIGALRNDIAAGTHCVDFARSSVGPENIVETRSTRLTFIPFAKDAVTVAVRSNSALNDGVGFTTAELRAIYTCALTTHDGVALTPLLPQPGSGTRSFFLRRIGVTEPQIGSCVDGTVQEHDGTALDTGGDIAPYSVAQYIAQTGGVVADRHGVTVLSRLEGVAPRVSGRLNTAFPFTRDVYNVVRTAELTGGPTPDPDLISTFAGPTSTVCAQANLIQAYGFATLGSACGSTL